MKTATTMKTVLGFFAVCLALGAAAAEISGVTVRQRWPWSRLVDIDYVIADATQAVDIAVTAYNGSTPLTLPDGSLSGDRYGVSSDGTHRIVWDPTVTAYTNAEVLAKFKVALTTQPVSAKRYMIIDLSAGTTATSYPVTYTNEVIGADGQWDMLYKTERLVLRRVEAGSFVAGSPVGEKARKTTPAGCETRELQHPVILTRPFYIGVFEMTQRQCELITGNTYGAFTNSLYYASRPADKVNYNAIRGSSSGTNWPSSTAVDATSILGKLRSRTGNVLAFDLPTEAQWEYACRAGTTNAFFNGGTTSETAAQYDGYMTLIGRFQGNYSAGETLDANCSPATGTATVGSYLANPWGLYDMSGNVWECTRDWCSLTYPSGTVTDPVGAASAAEAYSAFRSVRGGGWNTPMDDARAAARGIANPSAMFSTVASARNGFRLYAPVE